MPSANAPSSSAGATATDLRYPSTSVNQRRTKRISRSSSVLSTNSSCLSTATVCPAHVSERLQARIALAPRGKAPRGASRPVRCRDQQLTPEQLFGWFSVTRLLKFRLSEPAERKIPPPLMMDALPTTSVVVRLVLPPARSMPPPCRLAKLSEM